MLASLARQKGAPDFEVLVALDGSRREPRVPPGLAARLLRLPPRGPYAARNAAAAAATGEVLLFTDSDCLAPPGWVAHAARLFESGSDAAVQGASRASSDSRLSRLIQAEYERYVATHALAGFRRYCDARNFAVRAALIRELPWPDTLPRGGDTAYGWLLQARGIPIRYEAGWWVEHRHPRSRWEEGRRAFAQGKNGALWSRRLGVDLFASAGAAEPRGPGAWLLGGTHNSRAARRAAALALLPVAGAHAVASAILPGVAGRAAFSRFRRAAHLAGRLAGTL